MNVLNKIKSKKVKEAKVEQTIDEPHPPTQQLQP
jgi:hypothetical protein